MRSLLADARFTLLPVVIASANVIDRKLMREALQAICVARPEPRGPAADFDLILHLRTRRK